MDIQLQPIEVKAFGPIWEHIKADFPPSERPPRAGFEYALCRRFATCYRFGTEREMIGYALIMKNRRENIGLIWFLAIVPEYRGQGYGGQLLQAIDKACAKLDGLVIEVERVCDAGDEAERKLRESRLRFYLRDGYQRLHDDILLFGVPFHLMGKCFTGDSAGFFDALNADTIKMHRGFYGRHAPLRKLVP